MRKILSVICLTAAFLMYVPHTYAEPSIDSFSPSAGWAGTSTTKGTLVQIKGSGFSSDSSLNTVYFYDNVKAQIIPSKQVKYVFDKAFGSPGSSPGQLIGAQSMTIDEQTGYIYVTNQLSNARIEVFDETGKFIKTTGSSILHSPMAVALDKKGNIYVAEINNPTHGSGIFVFDNNGNFKKIIGGTGTQGALVRPYSISLDDRGYLYVIDLEPPSPLATHPSIVQFDDQGIKQFSFNGIDEDWGSLVRIAVDPRPDPLSSDRIFYISDRNKKRIYKYDTFLPFLDQWDFPQSSAVENVVVDADGNIYIDLGTNGIGKFNASGKLISTVITDTQQGRLKLRAVDKYKRIYLAEYNTMGTFVTIRVYKPEDADEILVTVPQYAETGPITIVTPMGGQPPVSVEDFTVKEDLSPVAVNKVELTQGLASYRLVAGKETLIWAKLSGIFDHPVRDRATVYITRFDGKTFDHVADHYKYDYKKNETVIHFHIPTSINGAAGKYGFDVAIWRIDTPLLYKKAFNVEYYDTMKPNLVFVRFTDIPYSQWGQTDPFPWLDMTSFIYGIEEFKRTFPVRQVGVHFSAGQYRNYISDGVTNDSPDNETGQLANDVRLVFDSYNTAKYKPLMAIGLIDADLNNTFDDGNGFFGVDYGWNPGKILTFFYPGSMGLLQDTPVMMNDWGALMSHEVGHSFYLVKEKTMANYLDGSHSKNSKLTNEKGAPLTVWSSIFDMHFPGHEMDAMMSDGGSSVDGAGFFESMTNSGQELDYHVIFDALTPVTSSTALASQPFSMINTAEYLSTPRFMIMGSIDGSGSVSIQASFLTTDQFQLTPIVPSDHTIVFLNRSGDILSQDSFIIDPPLAQGNSALSGAGSFYIVRPFPVDTETVEIRFNEKILKSLPMSDNPPFINDVSVQISEFQPVVIRWSGGDKDGDPVTYSIYFSSDGGETYLPVVLGINGTQFNWDDRLVGGNDQCLIKVSANDGFHLSSAVSNAFALRKKKPTAVILTPSEGSTFGQGSVINLRGAGFDPEDGLLSDSDFNWRVDTGTDLGTGNNLAFQEIPRAIPDGFISMPLEVGQHTIQLDIMDSDGNMITSEVTIAIFSDHDRDGFSDLIEEQFGGDPWNPFIRPNDLDQDDDGVMDVNEDLNGDGIVDPGETDPNNSDSDDDGLVDGLELGLVWPQSNDTNLAAGVFVQDADHTTTTDPTESDTDSDGLNDGNEDWNENGRRDIGETNPLDPDTDKDNVLDGNDNCPLIQNTDQVDFDEDAVGDACDPDDDNDGVLDHLDQCPQTIVGGIVDSDGCSIQQICPCDSEWKNHGKYVSCVAKTAERFVEERLISEQEKDLIVSDAAKSKCGVKPKK